MPSRQVFDFLKALAREQDLRHRLRTKPKAEVLEHARKLGYEFSVGEFDDTIWGVEQFLAEKVGEPFGPNFSLWETMWGKYYLDYLVDDVLQSLSGDAIDEFLNRGRTAP